MKQFFQDMIRLTDRELLLKYWYVWVGGFILIVVGYKVFDWWACTRMYRGNKK